VCRGSLAMCDCVSAVLHAVLTRAATLRALFDATSRASWIWVMVPYKSSLLLVGGLASGSKIAFICGCRPARR
jgi:hypothetical protein